MELLWSPRSPFVRKVTILLHETGLVDRVRNVRAVASMSKVNPEIVRHNPLGKIPVLLTDDLGPIFDSTVICEYLDRLHDGPRLHPSDARDRITALRRQALGDGVLDVLLLMRNEVARPDGAPSPTYLAGFEQKVAASLAVLEAEAPALGDSAFSIGHIAIGCALSYLDFRFSDRDWRGGHPALASWHAQFEFRPSVIATTPGDESMA
ncbi:glutathione S-transferase family protein [Devosia sp.]|uniref:glutathione S-transferase family protein n=1 Tax=Devosia sp. TaxID=1871048 RepID=UPI0027333EB3|nr:glutathione S-transferase N-terminal domain-containing protein [Devosia sp.]MDP2782709.1 glutathione S-transferase N-terminal domain-containing protein [Devosia sp.]